MFQSYYSRTNLPPQPRARATFFKFPVVSSKHERTHIKEISCEHFESADDTGPCQPYKRTWQDWWRSACTIDQLSWLVSLDHSHGVDFSIEVPQVQQYNLMLPWSSKRPQQNSPNILPLIPRWIVVLYTSFQEICVVPFASLNNKLLVGSGVSNGVESDCSFGDHGRNLSTRHLFYHVPATVEQIPLHGFVHGNRVVCYVMVRALMLIRVLLAHDWKKSRREELLDPHVAVERMGIFVVLSIFKLTYKSH